VFGRIDTTSESEIPSPMSESEIPSSSPVVWASSPDAAEASAESIYILGAVIGLCILLIFYRKCCEEGTKNYGTTVVFFIKFAALLSCHGVLLDFALNDEGTDAINSLLTAMCIIPWVPTLFNLLFAMKKQLPPQTPQASTRLEGNNTYEDFTIPYFRALVLGFTQCGLIIFYVDGMQKKLKQLHQEIRVTELCDYDKEVDCVKREEYLYYYWIGVFVQLGFLIGNDSWGSVTSSVDFWASILRLMKRPEELRWSPETELLDGYRSRAFELLTRSFFSLVINPAALGFIVLALPFQVAVSSPGDPEVAPLDFVLNVVAAFFIIEIDNLAVPQTYEVTIVEVIAEI
jgi:hypothetical protein